MTFDGLYYSYQGNCTYVLVEEIEKTVDNFGIYIDNYHCDAEDVVSCPRALIVRHETQEVRIETVKPNTLEVEVLEEVTFHFLTEILISHQPRNYIHSIRRKLEIECVFQILKRFGLLTSTALKGCFSESECWEKFQQLLSFFITNLCSVFSLTSA